MPYKDLQTRRAKAILYSRAWQKRNPDKVREGERTHYAKNRLQIRKERKEKRLRNIEAARKKERHQNLKKYGITQICFEEMQNSQSSKCLLCQKVSKLYVDHSHKSGKVRGLLCNRCNLALGLFRDDFSTLLRAADYVRKEETHVRSE